IVTNLVMNSIHHAYDPDEAGQLRLQFEQDREQLMLIYSDDGRGISPDHLKKIFEPFFTTARQQGGSGLGLHLVYNLVTRKLQGSIQCESEPGQGTTFIIKLPLTVADE
ncbi:MAG: ATP-binding protein, partial [Chloroflexota bacterium]